MERRGRWASYFLYQRQSQLIAELLDLKEENDELKAQSNNYYESGIDYLKRVVQIVELEFKIKAETKGSATYLYGYGTGAIGISKDSKDYAPVGITNIELQHAYQNRLIDQ
jgi:hypothetical protein